jgi:hypothetical protein
MPGELFDYYCEEMEEAEAAGDLELVAKYEKLLAALMNYV